uniref:ABC1 atypical kinase-like domain-containing protein n=1 Tax=Kalanchoe fedtschenkoi TaxID=63787 RepID=A0A7N0VA23_KALFE
MRSRCTSHQDGGLLAWVLFSNHKSQDIFTSLLQDGIQNLPKLVENILQTSNNTGLRGAVRQKQDIQAVIGVGTVWLANVSASTNASAQIPTQLKLFEKMGATYIKLGQFIASAPTLFPSEYVEDVFDYVDPNPLASASIAQVHVARLKGVEEDVVIKVLEPGVDDILVADLNFIYLVAQIFEFLSPDLSRTSLIGIVNDIRVPMLEEVYFQKEAANSEAFRRYLVNTGLTRQATAPKVHQQFSNRRVLIMERLYGVPFMNLNFMSSFASNPWTSLITTLKVWFGSLLACETFHVDVHANLYTEGVAVVARGPYKATVILANIAVDERQMNDLFLDVVRVSESYVLRFPQKFVLLMKQLMYFDHYTRLLEPDINMLQQQRISIASNH